MNTPLFDGELVHSSRILYTPSPFARASLLHLQEVGSLQAWQPHASSRQGLASYLFFLVESGSGLLDYAGNSHTLQTGDCVFLDCRKPHRHHTGEDLWRLRWVHFYGPNMGAIYKKYQERGGLPTFHARCPEAFRRVLETLYTLAGSDDYVRDMQIYGSLVELLTLLMKEGWHPGTTRTPEGKNRTCRKLKNIWTPTTQRKSPWTDCPSGFISINFT